MSSNRLPLTVILEDIRSAYNVGSIFRTSDAVSLERLMLTGITPYPPHNKIPKTALGSIKHVPWEYVKDGKRVIDEAATGSNNLISIEVASGSTDLYDHTFQKGSTILFGNEINGVSKYALSKSAAIVHIPMFGSKISLNIASAYAIVVYEIIRQWKKVK